MAALDLLAPDQRAVVGLVLRQGHSYQEIADLLGISRSAVRSRAHAGLSALAPADAEVPADEAAQLADFLLGQQDAGARDATRALVAGSPDAARWASTVAARLRELAPGRVPDVDAPRDPPPAPHRSSRLGGALLIGGTVLVVAAAVAFLLLRGGDDQPADTRARATATPASTPRVVGQVPLRAVAGGDSRARGTMALFLLGSQLGFQIQARSLPANRSGETYAVWFTGPGSQATLIGVARDPVAGSGTLVVTGPPADDAARFPQQLAAHRRVVVARERTTATGRRPGPAVLRGTLPSGSG